MHAFRMKTIYWYRVLAEIVSKTYTPRMSFAVDGVCIKFAPLGSQISLLSFKFSRYCLHCADCIQIAAHSDRLLSVYLTLFTVRF